MKIKTCEALNSYIFNIISKLNINRFIVEKKIGDKKL